MAEPYSHLRIGCTALSKRIVLGKPTKNGDAISAYRKDVTSDCLRAVIEKIGDDGSVVVEVDGVPQYEIAVRKIMSGGGNG